MSEYWKDILKQTSEIQSKEDTAREVHRRQVMKLIELQRRSLLTSDELRHVIMDALWNGTANWPLLEGND